MTAPALALAPGWAEARRILAVRLDNLGDVLVTTPAIHAIRAALPEAEITLLASPVGAQIGRLDPDVAEVIAYEAPWVDPWQRLPHDPAREQAMIERLRAGRFDAAVIFTSYRQSSLPAAMLCYLAGIPLRLAVSGDAPGSLLTTRLRFNDAPIHEVERALELVGAVGIPPADQHLVLRVPDEARLHARAFREGHAGPRWDGRNRPLVVVHPGCSMPARTYPPERFAEAIGALLDQLDAVVTLTGVDSERELTAAIREMVPAERRMRVHDRAGRLTFPQLCGLIAEADLVLTNNTGPMHVAAATGTPSVVLFALTNPPEGWRPWMAPHRLLNHEVPCRICYQRVCPYEQECIGTVTAAEIVAAARELGVGVARAALAVGGAA